MKKKIFFGILIVTASVYLTSCYNNKNDISSLPQVSFVNDIVPIVTSGACGCHGNGLTGQKQFSNLYKRNHGADTIYYDAIYSEGNILLNWANGVTMHPAYGSVTLTPGEAATIIKWAAQGFPDDQSSGAVGNVSFSGNIASIISSTCSGGSCHGTNGGGAAGPALNYTSLSTTLNSVLVGYLNNNWSGHGGGKQAAPITATLQAWIAQGMPK